jgi:hypothetical protein
VTVRSALSMLLALALGAGCALLVACGGSGDDQALIPAGGADAMLRELDRVERSVRSGDCESVGGDVSRLQDQVNGLSNRVDAQLRQRLQDGVGNLAAIAPDECVAAQTDTTQTTDTTETVPTQTTETTEPPVETTPPETTTTTEPPPVETQPPPVETEPPPTETIPDSGGGATVPPSDSGAGGGTGGAQPTP